MESTNQELIISKEAPIRIESTRRETGITGKQEKQLARTLLTEARTGTVRTAMESLAQGKHAKQEEQTALPDVETKAITQHQDKPVQSEQTLFDQHEGSDHKPSEDDQPTHAEKSSGEKDEEIKENLDLTSEQQSTLTFLEHHPDALDAYGKLLTSSPEQMQKMMDLLAKAFGEDEEGEEEESLSLFGLLFMLLRAMLEAAQHEAQKVAEEAEAQQKQDLQTA